MSRNIRIALASHGFLSAKRDFLRVSREEHRRRYREYISSDAWKRSPARLAELQDSGHRCRLCNTGAQLEVHHRTYERLGREIAGDLTTLCAPCHRGVTTMLKERASNQAVGQTAHRSTAKPISARSASNPSTPPPGLFRPLVGAPPRGPDKQPADRVGACLGGSPHLVAIRPSADLVHDPTRAYPSGGSISSPTS